MTDWTEVATGLAAEFAETAAETDRSGQFPVRNIERMKEVGYLTIAVPEQFGGGGADLATVAACQRILAGGCASTALAVNMHVFGLGSAAEGWYAGDRGAEQLFRMVAGGTIVGGSLTDAATGLNVRTSATPAKPVDGGYVISGRKSFCSLAPVLNFFWGTAADTETGNLLLFGLNRETPGLNFVDTWDTMAMRGTGSWDVVFDDVFVPHAAVQQDLAANDEELVWDAARERGFSWFAFTIASIYLGLARTAVRFSYDRVTSRTVTGASLPMARQPAQVYGAAEIELLLRPAEALVADGLHRRAETGLLSPADLNTIKHVAVNAADEAVDRCIRMVGGQGIFRKLPLERYYRDVRAGQFHPPNNDVALETIGKAALNIDPGAEPRWPTD
ncbi:acyl-CoA/acyl-ACP dehydrogenase [Saccharopolyspora sp. HNM0986]|uniref:acyl-CoA dehydrogenase family protein n=1 Tax=Saccharopolyspora galaxeae TaxID=2781241 RepID=UPI00190A5B83|nr:acyl-CoA dehydrogenase family protein [Saccharopolyspora sp. HNM0986]MBK0868897.1 acyl-CoA/acyl-ACP dehydrogenase [Saccharopolyspora sp. HNM0986]